MPVYWLTFRIADEVVGGRDWNDRYKAFTDAIDERSTRWWIEPTSFIAFESSGSIDDLARQFKAAIAPSKDLFVIREMDTKSARIVGANGDRAISALMPYLTAA